MRTTALAAIILAFTVSQADAQQAPCDDAVSIAKQLVVKYEEAPVAFGLQGNGNLMQVYASADGGWTVVTTTPDGMSCILAAGTHWDTLKQAVGLPS